MARQNIKSAPASIAKLPDEQLVQRIVRGNFVEDYGIIYDRYSKKVFNKCMLFAKYENAAEDLMHNIFLKAFTSLSTFKNRSEFSAWFLSLTYNTSIDYVYKQHSNRKINYPEVDTYEKRRIKVLHCDAEEKLLGLDDEELKQVLHKLYPEDRVILLMTYQDKSSIREIAQQLNVSKNNAEKRLIRARERAVGIYPNFLTNQKHNKTYTRINNFLQLAECRTPSPGIKDKLMSSAKTINLMLYAMDLFINKPFVLIGTLANTNIHKK
ncbi:MAG: RNA polymerase sigma factor [Bacteroidota bacterium]